jgi:tetratricopeptide (TPR) repeat protein/TolB-like protein
MIGQQISHYSIVEKLGEGGMGEVYLAQDLDLKRSVALKILPPEVADDPERLARFRREAESLAAINHPNIVTIFSIEQVGDLHIMTMERIEGRGLDELLSEGDMPLDQLLDVGVALSKALAAAHEKGITHRDLKPANLMLTEDGRLKVLDFGLAKLRREDQSQVSVTGGDLLLTSERQIIGTVPYMSPEQIEGHAVNGRSDLFCAAIVLYELATGQRPFQGQSLPKVMSAILEQAPTPVRQLRQDLPPGLERILARCLQKDPSDRYQTARELQRDLEALRDGTSSSRPRARGPWIVAVGAVALAAGFLVWRGGSTDVGQAVVAAGIVVMPFDNGGAASDEWFAAAMTHGVAERLSTVEGLIVRRPPAGWSDKTPEEVRDAFDVDYLLHARVFLIDEGNGRRVLVTPELSRTSDGALLSMSSCDRAIPGNDDILDVQRLLANAVVDHLEVGLGASARVAAGAAPTRSTDAYNDYLKGNYFHGKRDEESLDRAIECYERAVELDPDFVLARHAAAALPQTRAWYSLVPPTWHKEKIREEIEQILELDPTLPEAWATEASLRQYTDLDFEAAEHAWKKAIEYSSRYPNGYPSAHQWYSYTLSWGGRHEEALEQVMTAQQLDPVSPIITTWVGLAYYYDGRYDEAIEWMDQALDLDPDFVPGHWHRTWVCGVAGKPQEALVNAERARALSPNNPLYVVNHAYALAAAERRDEAAELLSQLGETAQTRYVSNYHVAAVHVALGDMDEAFRRLEQAFADRASWRGALKVDQRFLPLHADPRFAGLLERVGL